MKQYALTAMLSAGLAVSSPAQALIFEGGPTEPGYQQMVPVVWKPAIGTVCVDGECKRVVIGRDARVILEYRASHPQKKVYRIILDEKETWKKVLSDLHLVRPEATLETLINENKIKDRKLPVSVPGAVATITYTVVKY